MNARRCALLLLLAAAVPADARAQAPAAAPAATSVATPAATPAAPADPPRVSPLAVRVEPPLDPTGQPWRVQLLGPGDGAAALVAEEPAPAARAVTFQALPGKPYRLRLVTSRGDVWQTDPEAFVVGDGLERLLEPARVAVRGSVSVGPRPLPEARLVLSAGGRDESVSLRADAKGMVQGLLPRLGRWHALVTTDRPRLRREVDVEVARNPHGNELDFEITVIARGLEGEFVDLLGERIEEEVYLQPGRPRTSHYSEDPIVGGLFRIEWLENGSHFVRASRSGYDPDGKRVRLSSEPVAVSVFAGTSDPAWVTLTLRRGVSMKGRVVTSEGAGIPRAAVGLVDRYGAGEIGFGLEQPVDRGGGFVLTVLEGLDEVCVAVAAPGTANAVARVVPTSDEVVVLVEGPGGTLVVDQPYLGARRLDGRIVALFHRGCPMPPGGFPVIIRARGYRPGSSRVDTGTRWRSTMSGLEPGAYSACAVSWGDLEAYRGGPPAWGDCVHGTLLPGGKLELTLLP